MSIGDWVVLIAVLITNLGWIYYVVHTSETKRGQKQRLADFIKGSQISEFIDPDPPDGADMDALFPNKDK